MNIFRFKHFEVRNERSAMKVNTDGVLLGVSVHLSGNERQILDIGTGTGAIALMLAQRMANLCPDCITDASSAAEFCCQASGGTSGLQSAIQASTEYVGDGAGSDRTLQITGIDIDPEAAAEAAENFKASPWSKILTASRISLAELSAEKSDTGVSAGGDMNDPRANERVTDLPESEAHCPVTDHNSTDCTENEAQLSLETHVQYDLIVSNPPFYDASLLNPDGRKAVARHAAVSAESDSTYRQQLPGTCPDSDVLPMGSNLSFREILDFSARHLSPAGRVAMILPAEQEAGLLRYARMCGLHLQNILRISTVEHKPPRRIITEFGRMRTTPQEIALTIMANGHYTGEYLALMKDFYLFA